MNSANALTTKVRDIKNSIATSSLGISLRRNSPKILFGLGVTGVVAGTVLACNATTKVPGIIDERNLKLDEVKKNDEGLDEQELNRQITKIHMGAALQLVTAYAPAVVAEGAGIACLGLAQGKVTKRYLEMSAAYTGLQTTFTAYRNGVKKRYGEEVDREILFGIYEDKVKLVDAEGEVKEESKKVTDVSKFGELSTYSTVLFDERSNFFSTEQAMNLRYISIVVHGANEKLNARGASRRDNMGKVFFLNELCDMLDVPRTPLGNVVGWRYDPNNHNKITYDIFWGKQLDPESTIYGAYEDDADCARAWIRFNTEGNVLEDLKTMK